MNRTFAILLCFTIFASSIPLFSQTTLTGKVIDGSTNEPLPFANIYFEKLGTGTSTNSDGEFRITVPESDQKITVSFVGYKTEEINLPAGRLHDFLLIKLYSTDLLLQEVTVYAKTEDSKDLALSKLSIQSERITEISPSMPDVMRSVQALPGISSNNEFSAEFNVRGGNKDENLVLVNGAQVYQPYHIKEAANASVGIFNVELIKKVDMSTGGFSARYGDKMSSVLNIEYREGNKKKYTGAATLSLAYLDAFVEGPLSKKGSFIFGARKSYLEYVLSLLPYEDITIAKPSFYDVQGVLSYNFTPKNKVLLEFIHSGDSFVYDPKKTRSYQPRISTFKGESAFIKENLKSNEDNRADYFTNLFDIQSKNVLSGKSILNLRLSYYDQTDEENRFTESNYKELISTDTKDYFKYIDNRRDIQDHLRIKTVEGNISFESLLSKFYEIKSGFVYRNLTFEQKTKDKRTIDEINNITHYPDTTYKQKIRYDDDLESDTINVSAYKMAGYVENIFQLGDNILLNVGGRVDYYNINNDLNISPRIGISYKTGYGTTIRAAWGHFYQSPSYNQLKYTFVADSNTKAQKSTHYVFGVEQFIPFNKEGTSSLNFRIEAYYKDYENLISSYFSAFDRLAYTKENDATGYSKGFDFFSTLILPRIYFWISYSYLVAREDLIDDDKGEYPRFTDQTHTLAAIFNYKLGRGWEVGTRFFYGSGYAYTPRVAVYNEAKDKWNWVKQKKNSSYLPPYKRLDFRVSKKFTFERFSLYTFLDVSNVTNFENIQGYEYKFTPIGTPKTEKVLLWPVVPTLGIKVTF